MLGQIKPTTVLTVPVSTVPLSSPFPLAIYLSIYLSMPMPTYMAIVQSIDQSLPILQKSGFVSVTFALLYKCTRTFIHYKQTKLPFAYPSTAYFVHVFHIILLGTRLYIVCTVLVWFVWFCFELYNSPSPVYISRVHVYIIQYILTHVQ